MLEHFIGEDADLTFSGTYGSVTEAEEKSSDGSQSILANCIFHLNDSLGFQVFLVHKIDKQQIGRVNGELAHEREHKKHDNHNRTTLTSEQNWHP